MSNRIVISDRSGNVLYRSFEYNTSSMFFKDTLSKSGTSFENADMSTVGTINIQTFDICNFNNSAWDGNKLIWCTFKNCTFNEAVFNDVHFLRPKFEYCTFNEAILTSCLFRDATFKMCTFIKTKLPNTIIADSVFKDTDRSHMDLFDRLPTDFIRCVEE